MILVAHLFLSVAMVPLLVAPFYRGCGTREDDDSLLQLGFAHGAAARTTSGSNLGMSLAIGQGVDQLEPWSG